MEPLSKTAYELMSMGGDHRITIDDSIGYNIYGCKPYPYYSVAYSSSTSSSISLPAYEYIQAYWYKLKEEITKNPEEVYAILKREFEIMRLKMYDCYMLEPTVDIIFGPSGTDVEYLSLVVSDKSSAANGVHNIILAVEEVGSGIENAALGRYFSELTPTGEKVPVGKVIEGFNPDRISTGYIAIRDKNGDVLNNKELFDQFVVQIEQALSHQKRPLLHIVHSSKTGLVLPQWDTLINLKNEYGGKIDIVVDACQGRVSIYSINRYLSIGAMVLLTGSKFLSGPPFSGVLFLPKFVSDRIQDLNDFPQGLSTIFSEAEFPLRWSAKSSHPFQLMNFGLLLRWKAAVYEMNKIFKIPDSRLKFVIDCFRKSVLDMISKTPFLVELKNNKNDVPEFVYDRSPFEMNTIFTLRITPLNNLQEAKIMHKALYSNLSHILQLPNNSHIGKTSIQLGQPVSISNINEKMNATLRIAISARQISELALLDNDLIQTKFESDLNFIAEKMNMVLENFETIKKAFKV